MNNPLLADGLPAFEKIRPEHAVPAVKQRLDEYRRLIERIEALGEVADHDSVVVAETLVDNALANTWSPISHLHSVCNSDEWRQAYQECLAALSRFHTERGHNRALWAAYKALAKRDDFSVQDAAMQATVHHELRDFRLAGVELPKPERDRFGEINLRLSELGSQFGNQVLDATEAHVETFDNAEALEGLPEAELELLAGMARDTGQKGWLANLSYPAYRAIITYADDRALRERFQRAFTTCSTL